MPTAFEKLGRLFDRFRMKARDTFARIAGPESMAGLKQAIGRVQTTMHNAGKRFARAGAFSASMAVASAGVADLHHQTMGLLRAPVQVGMAYESAMSQVRAVVGDVARDGNFEKLKKQTRELGASTSYSARQVAEAQGFLGMAGMKTAKVIEAMPGVLNLAKAGHVELARAADVASNVMGAFGEKAGGMNHVANVMVATFTKSNTTVDMLADSFAYAAPIAAKVGVELHELAAVTGMLGNIGIQGSNAGTALRSALTRLAGPPKMAADALHDLGVSTKDASGNLRPLTDVLGDIAGAMEGMGTGDKMEKIKRIFGVESASAFAELLGQGKENIDKFAAELANVDADGGVAAAVAREMANNLEGKMMSLNSAFEEFQLVIFETLAPALTSLAEGATTVVRVLGQWAANNPTLVKIIVGFIAAVAGLTAVLLPVLTIASTVASGWGVLAVVFGAVKSAVILAIPALKAFGLAIFTIPGIGWILAIVAGIVALGIAIYYWRDEIIAAAVGAWEWIKNSWGNAPGWVKGLVALMLLPLLPFFAAVKLIKTHWGTLAGFFRANVAGPITGIFDALGGAVASRWNALSMKVSTGLDALGGWISRKVTAVGQYAGQALLKAMAGGVGQGAAFLFNKVKGALEQVRKLLPFSDAKTGPLSDLTYSGGAFVNTFAGGVEGSTAGLVGTIEKAAARASNALNPSLPQAGGGPAGPVRPAPLVSRSFNEHKETQNVVLDFKNVPRGVTVEQEGPGEIDMSLGYNMETA